MKSAWKYLLYLFKLYEKISKQPWEKIVVSTQLKMRSNIYPYIKRRKNAIKLLFFFQLKMTSVSTAVKSSSEFDKATDTRFIGQYNNASIYAGAADSVNDRKKIK